MAGAFAHLEARRARRVARLLAPYLEPGETVLDLGCGTGSVADELRRQRGARVLGLDALAFRRRDVPLVLADAAAAPFRPHSFDAVVVAFVLHHCADGGAALMREARRLARRRILVLEDRFDGWLDRLVAGPVDSLLNRLENAAIPTPHRFRPTRDWLRLWHELDLEVEETRTVRTTPILETAQTLHVLRPPVAAGEGLG